MQFIVIAARDTARFTDAEFAPVLGDEAERVRELYSSGVIRTAYGRGDVPGAVLLLEADSLDAARAHMATLPLASRGMLEWQIIPVGPYRGFAPHRPAGTS